MITSRLTRRLARSYLLVIMVLSLLFSGIIFAVVSAQLDRPFAPHRQLSPAESEQQFHQRWQRHNQEARQSVIMGLVVLNGLILVGGAALSVVLARRTLRPIEQALQQSKLSLCRMLATSCERRWQHSWCAIKLPFARRCSARQRHELFCRVM